MMKEMSLQEVQQTGLDILKDVHQFCEEHGICYTLFGGTMIGAIRHGGFVPWDDDVDIAMPRPDYERFLTIYRSKKGYRLFAAGTKDSYLAFSRVCEMEKTLAVNNTYPWTNHQTGIWLDIFPLDGAPDSSKEAERRLSELKSYWKRCGYARAARAPFSSSNGFVGKSKQLVKKLIYNDMFISNEKLVNKYIKLCRDITWGFTNHFWNCSYLRYGMREYQEMADYASTTLVPFEDAEFRICNGYDRLMRTKYGDYMQLPPEEKRTANHALCSYYWK